MSESKKSEEKGDGGGSRKTELHYDKFPISYWSSVISTLVYADKSKMHTRIPRATNENIIWRG